MQGLLLDVQDELDELNAVLDSLPGVRQLHAVMREIGGQFRGSEGSGQSGGEGIDRIGSWARRLTGKRLPGTDGPAIINDADLIDLGAAADVIMSAVQCRLRRLAALLGLLMNRSSATS